MVSLPVILLIALVLVAIALTFKKSRQLLATVPHILAIAFRKNVNEIPRHLSNIVNEGDHKVAVLDTPFFSFVLATHPDTARELIKMQNDDKLRRKMSSESLFSDMLHKSLVTVDKEEWRHQRSTMSPAFHFDFLKQLMPLMTTKTEELLAKLPVGEKFEAKDWLYKFTIDVLGLTAFGVDFNAMHGEKENEYYESYKILFEHGRNVVRSLIPVRILEKLPIPSIQRAHKAKAKMISMTHDVLEKRKKDCEKKYLIDMMLDAQPSLGTKEFEANIFLFFLAGHETTASALCWALYLLAEHQDMQARVREEVDRVLCGEHAASGKLKELVYMDMFIKEVLRYGTPIPFVPGRVADVDVMLGDQVIPKGQDMGISIYSIHHNPAFWPNPHVFNPDRFASEEKHHPYSFLPFLLGNRVCIGNNFSLIEQKIFLSMLLQRYTIAAPATKEPFQVDPDSLAHIPNKVDIILNKRK